MNITILCAGKIKEKYFTDAVKEYSKRLSRYIDLKIEEVADEPTPDHASAAMEEKIKAAEGERMLKKIRTDDYVIALAIDGKKIRQRQVLRKHQHPDAAR